MSDATKQLEDELKQKHGEVFRLDFQDVSGPASVYFRPLTEAEYNRFLERGADKDAKRNVLGLKEAGRCALVHPTGNDLDALLARRPGVLIKAANEALAIANGEAAEQGKRL